ncbi:MAG: hypothetical protein AAF907_11795 [Planctomycetota bacterium]
MIRHGHLADRSAARPTPARRGASLVDGAIVLGMVAFVAATLVPQLKADPDGSKDEALRDRLQMLRGQIELYRVQHGNVPPGSTGGLVEQMCRRTDAAGNPGDGPECCFGPYLLGRSFPANPVTGADGVLIGDELPGPDESDGQHGWRYCPKTGELHPQGDEEHAAW